MTRNMTAAMNTSVASDANVEFFHLFEIVFSSGTVRYTTMTHDVSWNSLTWTGIGGALSFDMIDESPDLSTGLQLTLDGVKRDSIDEILTANFLGRAVTIWLAHHAGNYTIVADPVQFGPWLMLDAWTISVVKPPDDPGTVRVTTRVSTDMSVDRVAGWRTNPTSYKRHFPNDEFYSEAASLVGKALNWGGEKSTVGGGGGRGGGAPLDELL